MIFGPIHFCTPTEDVLLSLLQLWSSSRETSANWNDLWSGWTNLGDRKGPMLQATIRISLISGGCSPDLRDVLIILEKFFKY